MYLTTHMNFLKRATTSILRRPGKSIILLFLVFILGSVITGAISVVGAITNTEANLRRNMQPVLTITTDHAAFDESWDSDTFDWNSVDWNDPSTHPPQNPVVTPEHIRAIGALDTYVRFFDYVIQAGLWSPVLNRYEGEHNFMMEEGEIRHFSVTGTSAESMVQIDAGAIVLTEGSRQFTQQELNPGTERSVAIISEAFAIQNDLTIGSNIQLFLYVFYPDESGETTWCWGPDCLGDRLFEEIQLEFEIVGLFDIPADEEQSDDWQRMNELNTIYVPNWAIEDLTRRQATAAVAVWDEVDDEPGTWSWIPDLESENIDEILFRIFPLFLLNDPDDVEAFSTAAMSLLPAEGFYEFVERSGGFENISSSMATMRTIANWILIASVIATLLILSLLITLFLRDRRYEMGVYLALGEKKGKIVSQILLEVVATSFVAITLAVGVGTLTSNMISRNMLMNQLTAEATSDGMVMGGMIEWDIFDQVGMPSTDMSAEEMMEQFDVSLSILTIGVFYGVGLGAVVISSLIPVIYVITLNPKKVLM